MNIRNYLGNLTTRQLEYLLVPPCIVKPPDKLSPDTYRLIWEILYSRPKESRRLFSATELETMTCEELSALLKAMLRLPVGDICGGTVRKILNILENRSLPSQTQPPGESLPITRERKNSRL